MQTTTNYGLRKPEKNDFYSVENNNFNVDIIDTELKKNSNAVSTHTSSKSNPHGVTKSQVGLGNVDNTSDLNKPVSTATKTELDKKALAADLTAHTSNVSNPHKVTKSQVGLSNVPNVATNDQTPTYTVATANAALASGEKLSVAFGKISKAVSSLISHLANVSNPHKVTASQVGAIPVAGTSLSTSILAKAITLADGAYIFKLLGDSYTGADLPNTAYSYGEAMVLVRSSTSITVVLFGAYSTAGSRLAVNHYNGSTWYGWNMAATVEELSSAMEAWTFTKNIAENATVLQNLLDNHSANLANGTSYEMWVNVYYSGDVILGGGQWKIIGNKTTELYEVQLAIQYTAEKSGVLIRGRSKFDGVWSPFVNIVTETILDNYVKNTGGTINGKTFVNGNYIPLVIRNTDTAEREALIDFNNTYGGTTTYLGALGFNGDKKPVYYNAGVGSYELLHTGNKPIGAYTGDGKSADRTITTGGTGQVVCVTSASAYTMAIVTPNGYIGKTGDDVMKAGTDAYMFNGTLVVRTTSELFNSNGVTYNYQVL